MKKAEKAQTIANEVGKEDPKVDESVVKKTDGKTTEKFKQDKMPIPAVRGKQEPSESEGSSEYETETDSEEESETESDDIDEEERAAIENFQVDKYNYKTGFKRKRIFNRSRNLWKRFLTIMQRKNIIWRFPKGNVFN